MSPMPRASERTHTDTNSEISDSGLVKCEIRVSVLGHLQPLPKYQFHRIVKSAIANHFHRLVIVWLPHPPVYLVQRECAIFKFEKREREL